MFYLGQNLTLESFQLCLWAVFHRTNFFKINEHFFQKTESSLEVKRVKKKLSENPTYNIFEFTVFAPGLI